MPTNVQRVDVHITWGDVDSDVVVDTGDRTALVCQVDSPLGARALLLLEPDVILRDLGEILDCLVTAYEEITRPTEA